MPTIAGMRRRGVPPEAISEFQERAGVARSDSTVDMAMFDFCVRNDLEAKAARRMVVLDPIKVVVTNWPEGETEMVELENIPGDEAAGTRRVPFGREIFIERDDFMEDPPKKFFRLAPGREVRLKGAYAITCEEVVKDGDGNVVELRCTYDPATQSGNDTSGRKIRGVMHWVSAEHGVQMSVRLYDTLFLAENPEEVEGADFTSSINPESLVNLENAVGEPDMAHCLPGERLQFMRKGYFYMDPEEDNPDRPTFNRIVPLKDSWAKLKKKNG